MIRLLRCLKLRNRLLLFLTAALLFCSLTLLTVSVFISRELVNHYIANYVESSQRQIVTGTEAEIDEVVMVSLRLSTDPSVYNLVKSRGDVSEKRRQLQTVIDGKLLKSDKSSIGNICMVGLDGTVYEYRQNGAQLPPPGAKLLGQIAKTGAYVCGDVVRDQRNNAYIPVGSRIKNFYTGESMGSMVIYLHEESFNGIYQNIVPDWGYSFILSSRRYILSHPDKRLPGTSEESNVPVLSTGEYSITTGDYDGRKAVVAVRRLSNRMGYIGFDWEIVSVLPYSRLLAAIGQDKNIRILVLTGTGMLVVAMMFSVFISKKIVTPLRRLKDRINALGAGRLDALVESHVGDELWELDKSYNDMVARINDLIEKNNREKEKQREMELTALQAEINPHFLYNTLDAIGWIARMKREPDIVKLVTELSSFFRLSLHKGDKFITLEEEIRLVQSFVVIEQMLSPGKFEVEYHIPEEIRSVKMLKIVLQPIVENSIKHGVGEKKGRGKIVVSGRRDGDNVRLEVTDDGVGFDPGQVDAETKTSVRRSGYGLKNVDERIRLEYGPGYGLSIESRVGVGTRVTVLFAVRY